MPEQQFTPEQIAAETQAVLMTPVQMFAVPVQDRLGQIQMQPMAVLTWRDYMLGHVLGRVSSSDVMFTAMGYRQAYERKPKSREAIIAEMAFRIVCTAAEQLATEQLKQRAKQPPPSGPGLHLLGGKGGAA